MRVEKRTVDLNAYISDVRCIVKADDYKKQLSFSFKNMNYGVIVAVRMFCVAYDSFDDKIQFDENDFLEVKRADLHIKPSKTASFSLDVGNKYDIKKVEVSVSQIVYADGNKVAPRESKSVEYEIEVLQSSWSPDDHFEKDALSVMKEDNDKAICFPKIHADGWICVCGTLNSESKNICAGCGSDKQEVFRKFNEEVIKSKVEEREKKEQEETERRKEQQRLQQEKELKKKKTIIVSTVSTIILAIVIGVAYTISYNIKYGLSDEEKIRYQVAQSNYRNILYFTMGLGNDFFDIARGYQDDDYSRSESKMSIAEKDKDYLYARGMYLASSLLYELLDGDYPEKYSRAYNHLIKLRKADIYNDVLIDEALWVKNSSGSNLIERRDSIDEAINKMENYMNEDTLNPAKIEIASADMPNPDYSKVYGINLGILYYEDGYIRYVGEVLNGQANGFGKAWYSSADNNKSCCEGTFENGVFKSGTGYDTEGNKINADELGDLVFAGDFEMVKGLKNTASSEYVAQQNANNEERDKSMAQAAVKEYLNMLANKQNSITNITWINVPDVSGDYYYFSCTVEFGDLKRNGTVTVVKQSDGSFKATGLDFDD